MKKQRRTCSFGQLTPKLYADNNKFSANETFQQTKIIKTAHHLADDRTICRHLSSVIYTCEGQLGAIHLSKSEMATLVPLLQCSEGVDLGSTNRLNVHVVIGCSQYSEGRNYKTYTFLPGAMHGVIMWQVDSPLQGRDIQGQQCGKVGREHPKTLQLQKRILKLHKNIHCDVAASTFQRHHTTKH